MIGLAEGGQLGALRTLTKQGKENAQTTERLARAIEQLVAEQKETNRLLRDLAGRSAITAPR